MQPFAEKLSLDGKMPRPSLFTLLFKGWGGWDLALAIAWVRGSECAAMACANAWEIS